MKKVTLICFWMLLLVLAMVSVAGAAIYTGVREAGMGGCGVALSSGLPAVAYNPAGLLDGSNWGTELSLGGASRNLDQITGAINSASDPSQFLLDNYSNALDANGSLFGQVGINLNKVGVSVLIPSFQAELSKAAATTAGIVSVATRYDVAVTLGRTVNLPVLLFDKIDLGANLKYIGYHYGSINASGSLPLTATNTWGSGSGLGLDLGARTKITVPFVSTLNLGVAARDLVNGVTVASPYSRTDTFNADGTITEGSVSTGTSTSYSYPTSLVIGCAGTLPLTGLGFAADLESLSGGSGSLASNDTILHLGLEYPMLMNMLVLRGGVAAGQNSSRNTLGVAINVPTVTLQAAAVLDNLDALNNSYVVGGGFNF